MLQRLTCASKAANFFFFAAVVVGLPPDAFDADFAPDFGVLGVLFIDELDVVGFADFFGDLENILCKNLICVNDKLTYFAFLGEDVGLAFLTFGSLSGDCNRARFTPPTFSSNKASASSCPS